MKSSWLSDFIESSKNHGLNGDNVFTKSIEIDEFNSLSVVGPIDVRFVRTASPSNVLRIRGDCRRDLELVSASVSQGGVLKIKVDQKHEDIIADVHSTIFGMSISDKSIKDDAGDVKCTRGAVWVEIQSKFLSNVDVLGSCAVSIYGISQSEINVSITGNGKVSVSGSVETISANISGSGEADLGLLHAENGKLIVVGSGKIDALIKSKVVVRANGTGEITVHGEARKRDSFATGNGKIEFLNT